MSVECGSNVELKVGLEKNAGRSEGFERLQTVESLVKWLRINHPHTFRPCTNDMRPRTLIRSVRVVLGRYLGSLQICHW